MKVPQIRDPSLTPLDDYIGGLRYGLIVLVNVYIIVKHSQI